MLKNKRATILYPNEISNDFRVRASEIVETYLLLPHIRDDEDAKIGDWETLTELIAEGLQVVNNKKNNRVLEAKHGGNPWEIPRTKTD